jgi:hypothetical protein
MPHTSLSGVAVTAARRSMTTTVRRRPRLLLPPLLSLLLATVAAADPGPAAATNQTQAPPPPLSPTLAPITGPEATGIFGSFCQCKPVLSVLPGTPSTAVFNLAQGAPTPLALQSSSVVYVGPAADVAASRIAGAFPASSDPSSSSAASAFVCPASLQTPEGVPVRGLVISFAPENYARGAERLFVDPPAALGPLLFYTSYFDDARGVLEVTALTQLPRLLPLLDRVRFATNASSGPGQDPVRRLEATVFTPTACASNPLETKVLVVVDAGGGGRVEEPTPQAPSSAAAGGAGAGLGVWLGRALATAAGLALARGLGRG